MATRQAVDASRACAETLKVRHPSAILTAYAHALIRLEVRNALNACLDSGDIAMTVARELAVPFSKLYNESFLRMECSVLGKGATTFQM